MNPIYDSEKIGSLYIPESYADQEVKQGEIVAAGKDIPWPIGTRVLIQPQRGHWIRHRLFRYKIVHWDDVVCYLDGMEVMTKDEDVLIVPDWSSKYGQRSNLIYLPPTALEHNQPVFEGVVARCGSKCREVRVSQRVIMRPGQGAEVGVENVLYYILPEKEILATLPDK